MTTLERAWVGWGGGWGTRSSSAFGGVTIHTRTRLEEDKSAATSVQGETRFRFQVICQQPDSPPVGEEQGRELGGQQREAAHSGS